MYSRTRCSFRGDRLDMGFLSDNDAVQWWRNRWRTSRIVSDSTCMSSDLPFGFQSGEKLFANRNELRIRGAEILAQLEPRRIERVLIAGDLLDEGGRELEEDDDVLSGVLEALGFAGRRDRDVAGAHVLHAGAAATRLPQADGTGNVHADDMFTHRDKGIHAAKMMQLDGDAVPVAIPARQQRSGKSGRGLGGGRGLAGAIG